MTAGNIISMNKSKKSTPVPKKLSKVELAKQTRAMAFEKKVATAKKPDIPSKPIGLYVAKVTSIE
jgi:hypothetical protein